MDTTTAAGARHADREMPIVVAHSSAMISMGLAHLLRDRCVRVHSGEAPADDSIPTSDCLMIGDESGIRKLQHRALRNGESDIRIARLLISEGDGDRESLARNDTAIQGELRLPLDCGERELGAAIERLLDAMELPTRRLAPLTNHTDRGLPPRARRRVEEYINAHLGESMTVRALALKAGLSEWHFAHAFKLSFGVSPHRYVMQRRIDTAIELLRQSDLSLIEVGLEAGFSDQSHFTRTFARLVGQTPSAFRARRG